MSIAISSSPAAREAAVPPTALQSVIRAAQTEQGAGEADDAAPSEAAAPAPPAADGSGRAVDIFA